MSDNLLKIDPSTLVLTGDTKFVLKTSFKISHRGEKKLLIKVATSHPDRMEIKNEYGDCYFTIGSNKSLIVYVKGVFPILAQSYSVSISYVELPDGVGKNPNALEIAWSKLENYETRTLTCGFKTFAELAAEEGIEKTEGQ